MLSIITSLPIVWRREEGSAWDSIQIDCVFCVVSLDANLVCSVSYTDYGLQDLLIWVFQKWVGSDIFI